MFFFGGSIPDTVKENLMLTTYFSDQVRLELIRRSLGAPHLDGFTADMVKAGYHSPTIQCYLGAAAHVSEWLRHQRQLLTDLDLSQIGEFKQHLPTCHCAGYERGNKHQARGASLFLRYLQKMTVVSPPIPHISPQPVLLVGFCRWMREHRGAQDETLRSYARIILDVLRTLGEDPQRFDPANLRAFVLDRAPRHGRGKAKLVVTALRTFVRYLIAQGLCPVGLDAAIPTIAGWRLAALPRYLPAADVERVLAVCDPATVTGARERAILLLLARLGLRAGDVCSLRLPDIDWAQATIRVSGKSHRAVQLPLSQEIGDALLHYLATARPAASSDHLFPRTKPPVGGSVSTDSISNIVRRNMKRAGVRARLPGAHLLRNSAATSLLAEGASLQSIAVLLRHRSLDTTTLYAKVDFKVLRRLARPWPEVSPC
jgi:integrase/recombinase XerD